MKEYKYLQRAIQTDKDLQNHIFWYFQKDIRYIFGSTDTCNCFQKGYLNPDYCFMEPTSSSTSCIQSPTSSPSSPPTILPPPGCCQDTFPDSTNNDLSSSCGSQSQGSNRLQRGLNYLSYLKFFYSSSPLFSSSSPTSPAPEFKIRYSVVPSLRHDLPFFLSSDIVFRWGFEIEEAREDRAEEVQDSHKNDDIISQSSTLSYFTWANALILMGILILLLWGLSWTGILPTSCWPQSWLRRADYSPIPESQMP